MSAVLSAAPTPVSTPQPISAATLSGTSSGILTTLMSGTIVSSENVPQHAIWCSGPSGDESRVEPSSMPPAAAMAAFSHR